MSDASSASLHLLLRGTSPAADRAFADNAAADLEALLEELEGHEQEVQELRDQLEELEELRDQLEEAEKEAREARQEADHVLEYGVAKLLAALAFEAQDAVNDGKVERPLADALFCCGFERRVQVVQLVLVLPLLELLREAHRAAEWERRRTRSRRRQW